MITGNDITFCQSHCSLKTHLANCSFGCNVGWNVLGSGMFLGVWGCFFGRVVGGMSGGNVGCDAGWRCWVVMSGGDVGCNPLRRIGCFSEPITQNLGSDVRKTQSSNKKQLNFQRRFVKCRLQLSPSDVDVSAACKYACKLLKACCASFAHGLDPHALRRY